MLTRPADRPAVRRGATAASPLPVRLAGIDGLRGLAAGSVLIYHVWRFGGPEGGTADGAVVRAVVPHLWHGVTLFFVLSGFLLYRPFAAAVMRGTPRPSVARYVRHRVLRIVPAYWVVLLVTAYVLQTALVADDAGPRRQGVPDPELLAVDMVLAQNLSRATLFTGIGPAWSLAVEAMFYALLPLLVLVGLGLRGRGAGRHLGALAPVVVLLAVGVSGKLAALTVVGWDLGVLRSLWGLGDLLAFGMLVAVVSIDVEDGRRVLPARWRAGAGLVIAATVAVGLAFDLTQLTPREPSTLAFTTLVALACALLVALVTMPAPGSRGPVVALVEQRAVAGAGVISYSVFLWHEPLLRWLRGQDLTFDGGAGFALNVASTALLTALLATITYHLVELPALRLKDRHVPGRARSRPVAAVRRMAAALGAMAVLAVLLAAGGLGPGSPTEQAAAERPARPPARAASGQ